nr:MAG TPA: hypothetical protein [Caudoviricetes sp.]
MVVLSANETLCLLIGGGHILWLTGNHPLESRGKHFKHTYNF